MSGKQWNMDKTTQEGIAARADSKTTSVRNEDTYYTFETAHAGAESRSGGTNKIINLSEEKFEGDNLRWVVDSHGISMKGRTLIARYHKGVKQ